VPVLKVMQRHDAGDARSERKGVSRRVQNIGPDFAHNASEKEKLGPDPLEPGFRIDMKHESLSGNRRNRKQVSRQIIR
jgi:hypothetical protein